ncbi:sugar phosphate isomerase/epimerase [Mesorhizobium sp. VK25A]|uniref:Sugar phosphate isomerase/epimerase n=1 Tax=Mesorhizobium vachelliae TaxID=3072309 RepID=A0ABU5A0V0_9HYPH|nr:MULTISPECIES: sugar phosphate isomerase/epimerase [unclassified Mesorhizobium]MDX8531304.1 sugar phosphate isomerase/epimerase [Mesorhizobium sp. VK25D]MDX8542945.1 sugar phosphate isomerase/epimerase [Mesorhizobium sp. VK25A]
MYPAIFARTYPLGPVDQLLSAIGQDGYEGMQFNLSCLGLPSLPDTVPAAELKAFAEASRAQGLAIAGLSGTYNMAHPDEVLRRAARARFANVVAAAPLLGAPIVTLCTGSRNADDMWAAHPDNASPSAWADMRAELDAALELAEKHDVRLGIEPEPGNVVADAVLARRILDEVGNPRLGIILDAANLVGDRLSDQARVMEEAVDLLGENIILAHAKDIDRAGKIVATGAGAVDLHRFLRLLRSCGYGQAVVAHGFEHKDAAASGVALRALLKDVS